MALSSAFKKFSNENSTMDSKIFISSLIDSGIFNFRITLQQCEQIFEKVKNNPNLRGINYQQFEACLSCVAGQTGCTRQQIEGLILEQSKKISVKKYNPTKVSNSFKRTNINSSPQKLNVKVQQHLQ